MLLVGYFENEWFVLWIWGIGWNMGKGYEDGWGVNGIRWSNVGMFGW